MWNFHTVENTNGTRTSEQEEEILWAVAALEKLGYPKKAAQARAERAWDLLIQEMTGKEAGETPGTPDASAITNRAFRVGR